MASACLSDLCAPAETEAAEDANIETMLELLPREVGFAVAGSFQQRYSLSSLGFSASAVTSSGQDAVLHSRTLQPNVFVDCFWHDIEILKCCSATCSDFVIAMTSSLRICGVAWVLGLCRCCLHMLQQIMQ